MADRSDEPTRTSAQLAGDAAETLVAARLAEAGWTVLARNVHIGRHELDLVAVDPGPPAALVIVEVRWRGGSRLRIYRRRRWITASGSACGRLPTGCWIEGPCRMVRRCRGCRSGSTWSSWNRATGSATTGTPCKGSVAGGSCGTRATLPPGPGPDPEPPTINARASRHGAHTRTVPDRDGAGRAHGPPAPGDVVRGGTNRQEVAHRAVRFDAAAARGRSPLRPSDPPLESQDEAIHLCRAQWDPHHRSRPDRPAPGRRPRIRPRDRRPWRPGPLRRDEEAGPGAGRPGGDPRQPAVRQQALAGRAC